LNSILKINPEKFTEDKAVIFEIINSLCCIKNSEIHEKMMNSVIFVTLTDLFERFPFSNILHNHYLNIISNVLNSDYENLKTYLLTTVKIQNIVLKHGTFPLVSSKNCMIRKGFMGHIHIIANILMSLEDKDSSIEKALDECDGWHYLFITQSSNRTLLKANNWAEKNLKISLTNLALMMKMKKKT
jgi:SIT4 phosphatase-associated protein.